jgi:hypothetical protein
MKRRDLLAAFPFTGYYVYAVQQFSPPAPAADSFRILAPSRRARCCAGT